MFTTSLQELAFLFLTIISALLTVNSDEINNIHDLEKRAPGWGKRDVPQSRLGYLHRMLSDVSRFELGKDDLDDTFNLNKRRPGWGKRALLSDAMDVDKRRPGWGKRSNTYDLEEVLQKRTPGWGKRSYDLGTEEFEDEVDENTSRSKRRPGWGKRSYMDELDTMEKRRPGWGKRTPGWGKRSVPTTGNCSDILNSIRLLSIRLSLLKDELSDTCPVQIDQLLQQTDGALYKA